MVVVGIDDGSGDDDDCDTALAQEVLDGVDGGDEVDVDVDVDIVVREAADIADSEDGLVVFDYTGQEVAVVEAFVAGRAVLAIVAKDELL